MLDRSGRRVIFTPTPARVLLIAALLLTCVQRTEAREVVYVANVDGLVSAFDAVSNEPIATITLPSPDPNDLYGPGLQPGQEADVAVAPSGAFAYVLQYGRLFVIDTVHNSVTGEILVSGTRLVLSPDGAVAYVAGCNAGGICVINTATQTISAVIATQPDAVGPDGPAAGIAISPDGGTLYVTGAQGLCAIDTATNTVKGEQLLAGGANAIAVTSDGRLLYATHPGSPGRVLVIATDGLSVIDTITVPRDPTDIAISPNGRSAYVTNRFGSPFGPDISAFVSVIDTSSTTVTATIPLGVGMVSAFGIAISRDGNRAYVTDIDDTRLFVIDTMTQAVSANVFLPSDGPTYLAVADVPTPPDSIVPPRQAAAPGTGSSGGGGCMIAPGSGTQLGEIAALLLVPVALLYGRARRLWVEGSQAPCIALDQAR